MVEKKYDYLVLGSGMAGLSFAALMAKKGKTVCVLEAHDTWGGYAHTYKMGDFNFCAQVHYVWGCEPGGAIYSLLAGLGLEKDVTWEKYDPKGYDHMVIPGHRVPIPNGFDNLISVIEKEFPADAQPIRKFVRILEGMLLEMANLPKDKGPANIVKNWFRFPYLLKYKGKTLQDVYDECKLSQNCQAVLIGQAGDFMLPPKRLAALTYAGLFGGYNKGAFYPTRHFKYFVDKVAEVVTSAKGCDIFLDSVVTDIRTQGDRVTEVETGDGRVFTADTIVCNMDPQATSHMIGREKFPKKWLKPLSYEYSQTGVMMYLGVKDLDLKKYGFGKFNIWHMEQNDMNKMWDEMGQQNWLKPWWFISTPTLHTDDKTQAPPGCEIMEIAFYAEYDYFKKLKDLDYNTYVRKKLQAANHVLDLVEKRYIPNLRKHIVMKVVGSPTTNEHYCKAPKGNSYGSALTPENIGLGRLSAKTPFKNFFWCNASSGWPGVHGAVGTGVELYEDMTGETIRPKPDFNAFKQKTSLGRFFKVMLGKH